MKVKAAEADIRLRLISRELHSRAYALHHIWHVFQTVGCVILLPDWPGHWRSLLHQDCQMSESPFGTQRDISQMCLQLAGCSQHHLLTWNVSWAGDNLLGFLLSHHKNPSEGQFCYGCPAHICKADSELLITKKGEKKPLLRNTFHFSLHFWCDSCWRDWVMGCSCMWSFPFGVQRPG